MTGACPPCSSHLPEKEVPACPSPTPSYLPQDPPHSTPAASYPNHAVQPLTRFPPPCLGPVGHLAWAHF